MDSSRIAQLLAPFLANDQRLTANDLSSISTYIDILVRWNARINLTAIHDPEEIVTRHFGESLFAARHLFAREAKSVSDKGGTVALQRRVTRQEEARALVPGANDQRPATDGQRDIATLADLGSGAGFPGLPIKLWAPHIALTLIESNHKKATFLREVARALTLTDIDIQTARAESLTPDSFDIVTLRAVERFEAILPIAANLLRPNGRLALLIGARQEDQAHRTLPRLLWSSPIPVPNSRARILLLSQSPSTAGT
jgi:16S rRNA (guanine527-N7)-methyltransferase